MITHYLEAHKEGSFDSGAYRVFVRHTTFRVKIDSGRPDSVDTAFYINQEFRVETRKKRYARMNLYEGSEKVLQDLDLYFLRDIEDDDDDERYGIVRWQIKPLATPLYVDDLAFSRNPAVMFDGETTKRIQVPWHYSERTTVIDENGAEEYYDMFIDAFNALAEQGFEQVNKERT